jgi:hypothetical protein
LIARWGISVGKHNALAIWRPARKRTHGRDARIYLAGGQLRNARTVGGR